MFQVLSIATFIFPKVLKSSILHQRLGFDQFSLLGIPQLIYKISDNVVSLPHKLLETCVEIVFVE